MTTAAITSEKTYAIEQDVKCRECGYNLRGLGSTGMCPECGGAVSFSITDTTDNFLRSLPEEAKRNLRVEVMHEDYGLWITVLPLGLCLMLILTCILIGMKFGAWGWFGGIAAGVVLAAILGPRLLNWRECRAIAGYLKHHCHDRRLDRCPLCYHDLSGDMADTCPECGCPVCVRQIV